jgi:hypothetical protein
MASWGAVHRAGSRVGDDQPVPVTMMTAALADRLRAADLTYPEAGATTGCSLPVTTTCAAPW